MGGAETKEQMSDPNWDQVEDPPDLSNLKTDKQFGSANLGKMGEEIISHILTGNPNPPLPWCKDCYLPCSDNSCLLCQDHTCPTKTKTSSGSTDCRVLEDPADAQSITQYCRDRLIHFLRCGDSISHFRDCEPVLREVRVSTGAKDPPKVTVPEVGTTSSCFQDAFSGTQPSTVSRLFNLALLVTEATT